MFKFSEKIHALLIWYRHSYDLIHFPEIVPFQVLYNYHIININKAIEDCAHGHVKEVLASGRRQERHSLWCLEQGGIAKGGGGGGGGLVLQSLELQ